MNCHIYHLRDGPRVSVMFSARLALIQPDLFVSWMGPAVQWPYRESERSEKGDHVRS